MKYVSLIIVLMITIMADSDIAAKTRADYEAPYQALLAKHIADGEKNGIRAALVDYASWGKDPNHKKAMQALLRVKPEKLAKREKMVFWINAYNLLTVDLIIKTGETETIRNQGSLFSNVWKSHEWVIDGSTYTLDQIEHEILRKMGEPRIHVAINCASLSCPDLLSQPYRVDRLEQQLKTQTQLFIQNQNKGVKVEATGWRVSKIFSWFEDDFGGEKSVINFIQKNSSLPKRDIIGTLEYDWNLNKQ